MLSSQAFEGELPGKSLCVGLIVMEGFAALPVAGFLDALRAAASMSRDHPRLLPCTWKVMTAEGGAVRCSAGFKMTPDGPLGDPAKFDYLVVIGGAYSHSPREARIIHDYLSGAAAAKVPLIGLCAGVFTLARAGLMSGRRACVSWFHYQDFITEFPNVRATTRVQFLLEADRMTCAGGTAAIHLAAHLLEQHFGRSSATQSMRLVLEDHRRSETTPQPADVAPLPQRRLGTLPPTVRRALLIMEERIGEPVKAQQIAQELGITSRTLQRYFARTLGITPREALTSLRLNAICESMKSSEASLSDLATEFGFAGGAHLNRSFRRSFGETPAQVRRRLEDPTPESSS